MITMIEIYHKENCRCLINSDDESPGVLNEVEDGGDERGTLATSHRLQHQFHLVTGGGGIFNNGEVSK